MKEVRKLKGYYGHVVVNDKGEAVQAENVEEKDKWAKVISFNVKKGNEEARELGFSRMNGFAMFGSNYSLAFMKGLGVVVKTKEADWQELFTYYTYSMTILISGIIVTIISFILFGLAFTPVMSGLAPEPRFYGPAILLLIGVVLLASSKSSMSYRL